MTGSEEAPVTVCREPRGPGNGIDSAADVRAALLDLQAQMDALWGPVAFNPEGRRFETLAALRAAVIPEAGKVVRCVATEGFAAPGDGGGALYRYSESQPDHGFSVRSADGAWWEGVATDELGPTHLCAVSAPDPRGRQVRAPALVTALATYRRKGVRLRALLGERYSPARDGAVVLNAFFPELAREGITITDPDGTRVLCQSPLYLSDRLQLSFGPSTTFERGFATGDPLLTQPELGSDVSGWLVEGGVWTTVDRFQTGQMVSVYGNDWTMRNCRITGFHDGGKGGQAIVFGGNNIALSDVHATTTSTGHGTGAFRCIGGTGGRFQNLHGEAGDDIFQFVPVTNSNHPRFDRSIRHMSYVNCYGKSKAARLMVASVGGPQDARRNTATVRNVNFIGVNGYGARRILQIANNETDGTTEHAVGWINVIGCHLDGSYLDQTSAQAINIRGDDAKIGPIFLDKVALHDNRRPVGLSIVHGSSLTLRDCTIGGERYGLAADETERLLIEGGSIFVEQAGGGHQANHPVYLGSTAVGGAVLDGVAIRGVASSKAGIRANAGVARLVLRDLTVDKAPGAVETVGVSSAAGATIQLVGEIAGSRDSEFSGDGQLMRAAFS